MTLPSVEEMKSRMDDQYWIDKTRSDISTELNQADPMGKHIVFSLGSVPNSKRDVVETALTKTLTNLGYIVSKLESTHTFTPSLYISWGGS